MRYQESNEQQALFRWAEFFENYHPELKLMYHVPNEGLRTKANGARLKAEGMKAGVPDICLPCARGGFHGLYIEMKAGNGKPTHKQQQWIADLNAEGYYAVICYGWEAAQKVIVMYLKGEIKRTDGKGTA